MISQHEEKDVISIDVKELIDGDKTAIKEKKKWINIAIRNEIERLFYLSRMGYYQNKNEMRDIIVLQEAYHKLSLTLEKTKIFKQNNIKSSLYKIWDKIVNETMDEIETRVKYDRSGGMQIVEASFDRFIYQLERMIIIMQIPYDKKVILRLSNAMPQHLVNLPEQVKLLELTKESYEYKFLLDSIGRPYRFLESNDDIKPSTQLENKYLENIMSLKIGIEIKEIEDIEKLDNKKVIETILIRAERLYFKQNLIVTKEERLEEYKKIINAFPDKELIIIMPEQQKIYKYLGIDEDASLSPCIFSRHYSMYEMELHCINEISKDYRVKILFPSVTSDQDYLSYKKLVNTSLKIYPNRKLVEVGIIVDNEVVYEYLNYYKPFDFLVLETQKLYSELYEERECIELNEFKKEYINEVREIHQHARIRKKPDYIMGEFLENKDILMKTLKMGFRNYIVTVDYINEYNRIITEYLKKIKNKF